MFFLESSFAFLPHSHAETWGRLPMHVRRKFADRWFRLRFEELTFKWWLPNTKPEEVFGPQKTSLKHPTSGGMTGRLGLALPLHPQQPMEKNGGFKPLKIYG